MPTLSYTIPGPAPGAPRQSQRDKWAKRPCVMAYRAWCDKVRRVCVIVPPASKVLSVRVHAYYHPPESLSEKKRFSMYLTRKRSKPDGDNILKAVCDALWKDDHKLGDLSVTRYWANADDGGHITINIEYE